MSSILTILTILDNLPPSSNWQGHQTLNLAIGVQVPVEAPFAMFTGSLTVEREAVNFKDGSSNLPL